MVEVRKRERETAATMMFRFSRRVRQSGTLVEARRRRFRGRPESRRKRLKSALYRTKKNTEMRRLKKLNLL